MRNRRHGTRLTICLVGLCGIALCLPAALTSASASTAPPPRSGAPGAPADKIPKEAEIYATYYGWYDNTPPGCGTAYSGCAGGTGTRAHPITFASDKKEFPVGTVIYYPTVEKYFVMGDDCQECDEDWQTKGPDGGPHFYHVDLWIGGKGGNAFDVINCEDALTQGMPNGDPVETPFILNPPSNLPVSTEPLFNARTGHCFGGATTETSYGRYRNEGTGECLEDPGYSGKSGTPAKAAPCSTGKAEDIAFDGAFFVVHDLCLQIEGSKPGAAIDFARCNGNPYQQWEINPNATIAWIQYTFCLAEVQGNVRLANCTGTPDTHWAFTAEKSG